MSIDPGGALRFPVLGAFATSMCFSTSHPVLPNYVVAAWPLKYIRNDSTQAGDRGK